MTDWFLSGDYSTSPANVYLGLLGLLLAFACGHVIAWVYMLTHSGLSYSRSFVNSLIVIPTIVALVMLVLSNNLVTAFGLMAVFAIVRFRNILRDTLDTTYILAVIVTGMACGTLKFATAVMGCALVAFIMTYVWFTSFGSRHHYDLIINLHWSRPLSELQDLTLLLQRHARRSLCASQRSSEPFEGTDLSYRVLLRDPARLEDMITEIRKVSGVSRVSGLRSEEESEI